MIVFLGLFQVLFHTAACDEGGICPDGYQLDGAERCARWRELAPLGKDLRTGVLAELADGRFAATEGPDGDVWIYDAATDRWSAAGAPLDHPNALVGLPDGPLVAMSTPPGANVRLATRHADGGWSAPFELPFSSQDVSLTALHGRRALVIDNVTTTTVVYVADAPEDSFVAASPAVLDHPVATLMPLGQVLRLDAYRPTRIQRYDAERDQWLGVAGPGLDDVDALSGILAAGTLPGSSTLGFRCILANYEWVDCGAAPTESFGPRVLPTHYQSRRPGLLFNGDDEVLVFDIHAVWLPTLRLTPTRASAPIVAAGSGTDALVKRAGRIFRLDLVYP